MTRWTEPWVIIAFALFAQASNLRFEFVYFDWNTIEFPKIVMK